MSLDVLFQVCTWGVMPAWLLLVFLPRHSVTHVVAHAMWLPLALAAVYAWGMATSPADPEGANLMTLEGVMTLLSRPHGALIGWVHYLAFDLFVGAWEVRDAERRGIHHGLVVPCLFFTLMAGPLGLALYAIIRLVKREGGALAETAAA